MRSINGFFFFKINFTFTLGNKSTLAHLSRFTLFVCFVLRHPKPSPLINRALFCSLSWECLFSFLSYSLWTLYLEAMNIMSINLTAYIRDILFDFQNESIFSLASLAVTSSPTQQEVIGLVSHHKYRRDTEPITAWGELAV